jgi:chaperonin cofactor prefoldin
MNDFEVIQELKRQNNLLEKRIEVMEENKKLLVDYINEIEEKIDEKDLKKIKRKYKGIEWSY